MWFDLLFMLVGVCVYAAIPAKGKSIFTFVVVACALASYYFLFWIWLVVLDGFSWVQWFFGFTVIMSCIPAIAMLVVQLSFKRVATVQREKLKKGLKTR